MRPQGSETPKIVSAASALEVGGWQLAVGCWDWGPCSGSAGNVVGAGEWMRVEREAVEAMREPACLAVQGFDGFDGDDGRPDSRPGRSDDQGKTSLASSLCTHLARAVKLNVRYSSLALPFPSTIVGSADTARYAEAASPLPASSSTVLSDKVPPKYLALPVTTAVSHDPSF